MAYCAYTDITPWIPTNYSTSVLANADITAHIVRADAEIDTRLAHLYDKFNGSGDTPATPALIKQLSMHLSTALSLEEINVSDALRDRINFHREQAEDIFGALMARDAQLPHETKTQTLTFGASTHEDWEPSEYQALIGYSTNNPKAATGAGPPNIAAQSVTLTTCTGVTTPAYLRAGVDYKVWYSREWRQWVFEALSSDVQTAATTGTVTISYNWDYRKLTNVSKRTSSEIILC